ncbi:MAG: L,D-transpeptidase family protein [Parachlamydiaceae bacterium]|nr:L,D-transpeptidase family protein [Parachlamydiaceae bacterium]
MSFPRLFVIVTALLFSVVALAALFKGGKSTPTQELVAEATPLKEIKAPAPQQEAPAPAKSAPKKTAAKTQTPPKTAKTTTAKPVKTQEPTPAPSPAPIVKTPTPASTNNTEKVLPEANRIDELFSVDGPKLPFVETITYKSRVAWQKGRPAWLADYARHYQTSRHFIARSLNGKPDYFKQDLAENARFNVLKKDKNIRFHLVVDIARSKMWFFCDDLDTKERTLLKTYQVGLGRVDTAKASGLLTPLGQYSLGNKVAIYKPKMMGSHAGDQVEMIGVFGTRWIPFDKEISGCTAPAKGLGIHGLPWVLSSSGERVQDRNSLGKFQSDGCVRLASEDMEELFAIIITKPIMIELVKDFHDAK